MKVGDIIVSRTRRSTRSERVYYLVENKSDMGFVVETLPINEKSNLLYIDKEEINKFRVAKQATLAISRDAYKRILHGDMDQIRHNVCPKWMKAYIERADIVHLHTMYGDHVYCIAEDWRAGINSGVQYIRIILGKILI